MTFGPPCTHYKIIQEGKRNWLNIFFNTYDIKLEQYEQQYENKFLQLSNNMDDQ